MREADATTIVALLDPIIEAGRYTAMAEPITVAEQVAFIRTLPARAVYHAAVDAGGRVLGIQDVLPDAADETAGEISTFVRLDALRRGVGRRLTEATLGAARGRGFRRVVATVRADNPGAVAFYENMGFGGSEAAYLDAKPEGTVRLLRILD